MISTRAQSGVRRACWRNCGRWMPNRWRVILSASRSKKKLRVFSDSIRHKFYSRTVSMKRFICFVPPISIPGDEALIVVPTFAMYAMFALAEGASVIEVRAGDNFMFPTEQLLAQISPRTRLIAVANPNNPTGTAVPGNVLMRIAQAAPQAAVLVDEAYFEFYGETLMRPRRHKSAESFCGAHFFQGLRTCRFANRRSCGRRATDSDGSPCCLALQRERSRSRSSARGDSRSGVRQPLCCRGATQSRKVTAGTWQSRASLLAEPREFCFGAHWLGPCRICPRAARSRNSGAGPPF